jgi:hypothetical protein
MKLPLVIATLSLALAVASPARAEEPAAPSEPATDAKAEVRYPPSSVRPKLIIGGVAIAGLAYAGAFITATSWSERDTIDGTTEPPGRSDGLKIPIVGPWIALGKIGCVTPNPSNPSDCGAEPIIRGVLYAVDGVIQLGGLGLIAEAIIMKTEANPAPKKSLALRLPGGVTVHPLPVATQGFTGVGFVGSF